MKWWEEGEEDWGVAGYSNTAIEEMLTGGMVRADECKATGIPGIPVESKANMKRASAVRVKERGNRARASIGRAVDWSAAGRHSERPRRPSIFKTPCHKVTAGPVISQ